MKSLPKYLPHAIIALLSCLLLATTLRGQNLTTQLIIVSSVAMFGGCWLSAVRLLGARPALHFVILGVVLGWGAEQLGSSYGWFFGSYTYTTVLGPAVGDVPFVIPLMWFALCYIAYVIANLIVWQTPSDGVAGIGQSVVLSLLAAMIVTAFDLGADPYMVFKLKAWIMTKTDGWWFGETLQGFFGWAFVSFAIVFLFRLSLAWRPPAAAAPVARGYVAMPMLIYGGGIVFQVCVGEPVETRTIAVFAMGIPLLCAWCGWMRWQQTPAASTQELA